MAKIEVKIQVEADFDTLIELLDAEVLSQDQIDSFVQAILPLTYEQLEELLDYDVVNSTQLAWLTERMSLDCEQLTEVLDYGVMDGSAVTPEMTRQAANAGEVTLEDVAGLMEMGVKGRDTLRPLLAQVLRESRVPDPTIVDYQSFLTMLEYGFDDKPAMGALMWLLVADGELTGDELLEVVEVSSVPLDQDLVSAIAERLAQRDQLSPEVIEELYDNGYLTDVVDDVRENRELELNEIRRRARRKEAEEAAIADDDYLYRAANSGNLPGFLQGGFLEDVYRF